MIKSRRIVPALGSAARDEPRQVKTISEITTAASISRAEGKQAFLINSINILRNIFRKNLRPGAPPRSRERSFFVRSRPARKAPMTERPKYAEPPDQRPYPDCNSLAARDSPAPRWRQQIPPRWRPSRRERWQL